jgi:hypothetical protein
MEWLHRRGANPPNSILRHRPLLEWTPSMVSTHPWMGMLICFATPICRTAGESVSERERERRKNSSPVLHASKDALGRVAAIYRCARGALGGVGRGMRAESPLGGVCTPNAAPMAHSVFINARP